MNYYFIVTLYLSILFPSIVGLVRFKRIDPDYYPFSYFLWLGCLNVIFGIIITHMGYYTIVNFNVYTLLESFVLLWLFKKWHLFDASKKIYYGLFILYSVAWLTEMIFITKFSLAYASYFRILY